MRAPVYRRSPLRSDAPATLCQAFGLDDGWPSQADSLDGAECVCLHLDISCAARNSPFARQKWVTYAMNSYSFTMNTRGRTGSIRCSDGQNVTDIDLEMSGSPEYDVLLAPLDLRFWASGAEIPRDAQHRILAELRKWLVAQDIRSNAEPPRSNDGGVETCRRAGCSKSALVGLAYCPFHYDETLLR